MPTPYIFILSILRFLYYLKQRLFSFKLKRQFPYILRANSIRIFLFINKFLEPQLKIKNNSLQKTIREPSTEFILIMQILICYLSAFFDYLRIPIYSRIMI
ncbi:unnamed protein product [Paramecium primaurelia]|uniref:Uncharacterized protein n=1 Tax=Paramecium primaurelia TaxID=5886 RepID=A0A8S1LP79_PARPR|nr:unnamed protein product [Paramecium primaurelia]